MELAATARVGDRVSFTVSDVFLPEPSEVLANLTSDVETEGVIVEFSDSGAIPRAYAVVRITHTQCVLVPASAIRIVGRK